MRIRGHGRFFVKWLGMDLQASNNMVDDILKKLRQPLATTSRGTIKQCIDEVSHTASHCLQIGQDDVNAYLLDVKDSAEYVKTQDRLNARLQELQQIKQEHHTNKARKTEEIRCVRAEEEDLKKQLKRTQQEGEKKVKAAEKRLEIERSVFTAYLALCGHVRLGTAPEAGGEVRGCVSVKPSDQVTFSLDPAALTPVRLTDRLWRLAAEGPLGQQKRLEDKMERMEIAGSEEKAAAAPDGGEEDKENEEVNAARLS